MPNIPLPNIPLPPALSIVGSAINGAETVGRLMKNVIQGTLNDFNLASLKWTTNNNVHIKQSDYKYRVQPIQLRAYTVLKRSAPWLPTQTIGGVIQGGISATSNTLIDGLASGLKTNLKFILPSIVDDAIDYGAEVAKQKVQDGIWNAHQMRYSLQPENNLRGLIDGWEYTKNLFQTIPAGFSCEIPYFGNDLIDVAGGGWTSRNFKEAVQGTFGKDSNNKIVNATRAMQEEADINTPFQPTWSGPPKDMPQSKINVNFSLINETREDYIRHAKFIEKFARACSWKQYSDMQMPPNIFRLIMNGRITWYWASASFKASYEGNYKYITQEEGGSEGVLVPEIFNISIALNNLTPENENAICYIAGKSGFGNPNNVNVYNIGNPRSTFDKVVEKINHYL